MRDHSKDWKIAESQAEIVRAVRDWPRWEETVFRILMAAEVASYFGVVALAGKEG